MPSRRPPKLKSFASKGLIRPSSDRKYKSVRHRTASANCRMNTKLARLLWTNVSPFAVRTLRKLTETHDLSVAVGDLQLLDGRWYITHAGLLRMSERDGCTGIQTKFEKTLSDPANKRWVFKSTVYRKCRSQGFTGYGDADPSNVSPLVRGAEMRIAETRAVNRALRKAYGIGLCSVEELGWSPKSNEPASPNKVAAHREQWQWPSPSPATAPRSALPSDSAT